MTPEQYYAAKQKLRNRFPIGARVRLTGKAVKVAPRYKDVCGTVVGYCMDIMPRILMDGRKSPDSWHTNYVRKVKC